MNLGFSNDYKLILENSRKEAIRHQSREIRPEHLLLALTEHPESKSFLLLKGTTNDISINLLRSDLDNRIFENNVSAYNPENVNASSLTERIIK